jgi:MFS family permease
MDTPRSAPNLADSSSTVPRTAKLAVAVAALGYFVDIYDLILFSVVRIPSLRAIGVPAEDIGGVGQFLLNVQMAGMLVGGIVWGVWGDKRGRLSVLFGSISMYSLANLANGFVDDTTTYAWLRFIAGIGLAGELGAGVTLVTELLDKHARGWATTLIAGVGICGALLAVGVSQVTEWYVAYWIGGVLGLLLLVLRLGVVESDMFAKVRQSGVTRGNFLQLFTNFDRARRYLAIVLVGVPIWYAIGILISFCDVIGKTMGMTALPEPPIAVFFAYLGLAVGDFASGFASQVARSRKKAVFLFLAINALAILYYFTVGSSSTAAFYAGCLVLGIANGYWAVFVTIAAEQFGTNLRATATTTAPNFVRGSLVPVSMLYLALRNVFGGQHVGEPMAAATTGAIVVGIAFLALLGLEETYGKDLDFVER